MDWTRDLFQLGPRHCSRALATAGAALGVALAAVCLHRTAAS